jgi:hypothetical protein
MLFAIIASYVSIQISPAPVTVKRPTSKKKKLRVDPQLWMRQKIVNLRTQRTCMFLSPSHVGQGEFYDSDTILAVGSGRRSDAYKRQHGVSNAQSIVSNDSIAFSQASSDYIHLPDMFCNEKTVP